MTIDGFKEKSDIWPEPDYNKLYDEGIEKEQLFLIKQVWHAFPERAALKHMDYNIDTRQQQYYENDLNYLRFHLYPDESLQTMLDFGKNYAKTYGGSVGAVFSKLDEKEKIEEAIFEDGFMCDGLKNFTFYCYNAGDKQPDLPLYSNCPSALSYLHCKNGELVSYKPDVPSSVLEPDTWYSTFKETYHGQEYLYSSNHSDEALAVVEVDNKYQEQLIQQDYIWNFKNAPVLNPEREVEQETSIPVLQNKATNFNHFKSVFGFKESQAGGKKLTDYMKQDFTLDNTYGAISDMATVLGLDGYNMSMNGLIKMNYDGKEFFDKDKNIIHSCAGSEEECKGNISFLVLEGFYYNLKDEPAMTKLLSKLKDNPNFMRNQHIISVALDEPVSDKDIFCRAGAAYIKDRCSEFGIKNDFLNNKADISIYSEGINYYNTPQGTERGRTNQAFSCFIDNLKEKNIFQDKDWYKEAKNITKKRHKEPEQ